MAYVHGRCHQIRTCRGLPPWEWFFFFPTAIMSIRQLIE